MGAEVCDKRTENPCCLERRALPGVVTRHFDQEPRLPGGVDAKGIVSSKILSKPSNIQGEREEALPSVPIDPKLNKAPPVHLTCAHLSSLVQGTYYRDNTAARARVKGDRGDWQPPLGQTRVFGPKPQASGLLKGAGSGPGGQLTPFHWLVIAGSVTIEQWTATRCSPLLRRGSPRDHSTTRAGRVCGSP